nr:hypothetical protein Iba_chr04bCG10760 [Ipomoea batatas]
MEKVHHQYEPLMPHLLHCAPPDQIDQDILLLFLSTTIQLPSPQAVPKAIIQASNEQLFHHPGLGLQWDLSEQ